MFVGHYEISLDEKNRIGIPSRVRKAIPPEENAGAWYLVPGRQSSRLELYGQRYYEKLAGQMPSTLLPDDEAAEFDEVVWSFVDFVEMDKQGRILLPEAKVAQAGLGKELMLVGARDHLLVMNRAEFAEQIASKEAQLQELRQRARAKLRDQQQEPL